MLDYIRLDDGIEIILEGEIDHHAVDQIRYELEKLIAENEFHTLVLNFSRVSFMDSSGIGMIIGRYKTMKARGGCVKAAGLHPPIERIFRLAGLHRIIAVQEGDRRKEA